MNQVVQRIGRVIRKHEGKDLALIYVIYISDTKDDDILQVIRKAIITTTTTPEEIEVVNSIESKRDSPINNKIKSIKPAEKRSLEKAYRIIESSLIEPMIIELKEEKGTVEEGEEGNNENQPENSKRLFKVRNSLKDKNKYYEVDIANKTCTCPDFNFRQNKCKHIVATELYLF